MTPARARELVSRFVDVPVLVVGDVMLDRFIVGRVTRISPEAPVPVVQFQSEHFRLGGAANVAHNIAALGGKPILIGVAGTDSAGDRLVEHPQLGQCIGRDDDLPAGQIELLPVQPQAEGRRHHVEDRTPSFGDLEFEPGRG